MFTIRTNRSQTSHTDLNCSFRKSVNIDDKRILKAYGVIDALIIMPTCGELHRGFAYVSSHSYISCGSQTRRGRVEAGSAGWTSTAALSLDDTKTSSFISFRETPCLDFLQASKQLPMLACWGG